jgi:hypothetical protein
LDINDWLSDNYSALQDASLKISQGNDLANDLLHYSIDQLLSKPNLQDIVDSGGAQFYCVRIMLNSWRSTTSEFYRLFRKPVDNIDDKLYLLSDDEQEEEDIQDLVSKINKELDSLHWYDQELFRIFVEEDHNISSLSRATGIPRTSISLTINRIRKHIKKRIK